MMLSRKNLGYQTNSTVIVEAQMFHLLEMGMLTWNLDMVLTKKNAIEY
jgi:hypothetical protein